MVCNSTLALRRFAIATSALMLCAAASAAGLSAEQPHPPPRYRLKVGQELVYRVTASQDLRDSNGEQDATGSGPRERHQWHITVARENDDGSWRLFIRSQQAFLNPDGSERRTFDSFDYCDLHPDGSYSLNEQTAMFKMLVPYELFCRLPDTPAEPGGEWDYQPPVRGIGLSYRVSRSDGPRWRIAATQRDDYSDGRYQLVRSYQFDEQVGLVTAIVLESKDLVSGQVNSRRTISLTNETQNDAEWAARFNEEGQRYLNANATWMALCYRGIRSRNVRDCRKARTEARAVLVAGREQAETDYFRDLFETNLQAHDKEEEGHLGVVKNRKRLFAAVSGFPTTWEARAFDGSTLRLADQRGKVVVLYFWSEGCEYCMLAAPQVSKLAAEFKDQDVSVVGMFVRFGEATNDDSAVPKHASTKPYRGFPHVEAKGVYDLYHLQQYGFGTPLTLVLDQEGKIREAFSGYSADLGQCVRKAVNDLLGETPVP